MGYVDTILILNSQKSWADVVQRAPEASPTPLFIVLNFRFIHEI